MCVSAVPPHINTQRILIKLDGDSSMNLWLKSCSIKGAAPGWNEGTELGFSLWDDVIDVRAEVNKGNPAEVGVKLG